MVVERLMHAAGPADGGTLDADSHRDERLIVGIVGRDVSALGALFDRFGDQVHALVVCTMGTHCGAEEVVEQVFFDAWCTADDYGRQQGSLCTWLCDLARRHAYELMRGGGSRSSLAVADA